MAYPDSSIVKSLFIEQKRFHDLGFTNRYGKVWELTESYGIKLDRSYDNIAVKDVITRSFRTKWLTEKSNLGKNPILRTYDKIKQNFIMEPYLYLVKKTKYRIALSKLRCSSHTLAIEKGRHTKPRTNISDRLCLYCSNNTIEDEKHFVVQCPFYSEERKHLFKKVHSINPSFVHMSDDAKFVHLFCSNDERILAWFGKKLFTYPNLNVLSFKLNVHKFLKCIRGYKSSCRRGSCDVRIRNVLCVYHCVSYFLYHFKPNFIRRYWLVETIYFNHLYVYVFYVQGLTSLKTIQ